MIPRLIVLSVTILGLAGCAGQPDGMTRALEYTPVAHDVEVGGEAWRVLEHPGNDARGGKIMTTPNLGAAAGIGVAQGLTLGLADVAPAKDTHEAAARRRLDATGRAACRIVAGYELIKVQFEFVYVCDAAAPARPDQAPTPKRSSKA